MWNPFAVERCVVLRSALSPESCVQRLQAETGSMWNPFSIWNHEVRGRVTEKGFRVIRVRRWGRNSMSTEASGAWAPDGNGTRIEVSFAIGQRWALGVWFAVMGLFCAAWMIDPPVPRAGDLPAGVLRLLPLITIALGLGGIAFGRWLARGDTPWLIDFLRRTLECEPDSSPIE
jgi:hypothetical protein